MELRSDGPTFEEVGSPSKIPRYRAPLPRAHPGATANISRAEVLPHDDELVDEYDEENESLYPNSDDDYVEQDEVYNEEAPNREHQQLPAKFFQEELGPPSQCCNSFCFIVKVLERLTLVGIALADLQHFPIAF